MPKHAVPPMRDPAWSPATGTGPFQPGTLLDPNWPPAPDPSIRPGTALLEGPPSFEPFEPGRRAPRDQPRRPVEEAGHVRAREPRAPRFELESRTPLMVTGVIAVLTILVVVVTLLRPNKSHDTASRLPAAGSTRSAVSDVTAAPVKPASPRLGVFLSDHREVTSFESWFGRPVKDVTVFPGRETWSQISNPYLGEWQGANYRLIYAVAMLPTSDLSTKESSMRAGARGEYDHYFTEMARRLVSEGQENAVLRIGWEFNLDSWPWGIKDHETFKKFFRHIVKAVRAVPGAKFTIDWNPNNAYNPYDATKYWPGDAYVDSVGVDAYDLDDSEYGESYVDPNICKAACRQQKQETAWDQVVYGGEHGLAFWSYFAAQHHKPLGLPEWGLWMFVDHHDGGGDNPFFIERMHEFITDPANHVAYASYFNLDGGDGEHDLIKTFPAGGKKFKQLFGPK